MADPIIPPSTPDQGVQPAVPPVSSSIQQPTAVAIPGTDPISQEYSDKVSQRNIPDLVSFAQRNIGTPAGDAASHALDTIVPAQQEFDKVIVQPLSSAKTPQEQHIKAAEIYKTVADAPQWGTALIRYLMGDKQGAANLVTGGSPVTTTTYDLNGKGIKTIANALGETLSRTDMEDGHSVSDSEFSKRGGTYNSVAETLRGKNAAAISASNVDDLTKGNIAFGKFAAANSGQSAQRSLLDQDLAQIKKYDPNANILSNALEIITKTYGAASTARKSKSDTGQTNNSTGTSDKTSSGLKAGGGVGAGAESSSGSGLGISGNTGNESGKNTAYSENKIGTTSSGNENENRNSVQTARNEIIKAATAKGMPKGDLDRYLNIFDNYASIEANNKVLRESNNVPSFITIPSDNQASNGITALQVKNEHYKLNDALTAGYQRFYDEQMKNHGDPTDVPSSAQLQAAYSRTPEFKSLQQNYLKTVSGLFKQDDQAPVQKPVADIPPAVSKPSGPSGSVPPSHRSVTPPKAKKSVAEYFGS